MFWADLMSHYVWQGNIQCRCPDRQSAAKLIAHPLLNLCLRITDTANLDGCILNLIYHAKRAEVDELALAKESSQDFSSLSTAFQSRKGSA